MGWTVITFFQCSIFIQKDYFYLPQSALVSITRGKNSKRELSMNESVISRYPAKTNSYGSYTGPDIYFNSLNELEENK